jgi:hypothetical protein
MPTTASATCGEALACYQRSIDLSHMVGDRAQEARTLNRLGDAHQAAGSLDAARRAWQRAFDILDQFGHPDAARVRAKLRSTGAAAAS